MEHLEQTTACAPRGWRVMNNSQKVALEVLANASEQGTIDSSFFSRFTFEPLDLMDSGFATAECEIAPNGRRAIEIVRVRITEEGRKVQLGNSTRRRVS